ncbi:unnamed protein product [Adineta ricciae]|uniref:Uncharacterized protein n=1 Tax=Adineta ricciae TaxID=249248 RepID=A0A814XSI1_ADIRI|nr:unnamed protein product [Adineta ricciae]
MNLFLSKTSIVFLKTNDENCFDSKLSIPQTEKEDLNNLHFINIHTDNGEPEWLNEAREINRENMRKFNEKIHELKDELNGWLAEMKRADDMIKSANELEAVSLKQVESINAEVEAWNAEMDAYKAERKACDEGLARCKAIIAAEKLKLQELAKQRKEQLKKMHELQLKRAQGDQYWKDRIATEIEKRMGNGEALRCGASQKESSTK